MPYLLNTPPEVRTTILKYLLIAPDDIEPQVWSIWDDAYSAVRTVPSKHNRALSRDASIPVDSTAAPHETTLAIARTCKQLCNEALPIYYGCNTFKSMALIAVRNAFSRLVELTRLRCSSVVPRGHRERQATIAEEPSHCISCREK